MIHGLHLVCRQVLIQRPENILKGLGELIRRRTCLHDKCRAVQPEIRRENLRPGTILHSHGTIVADHTDDLEGSLPVSANDYPAHRISPAQELMSPALIYYRDAALVLLIHDRI